MRELGRFFRTLCAESHSSWARHIKYIQECLNCLTHKSTGFTPHSLHFGEHPRHKLFELFPGLNPSAINRQVQLHEANVNLSRAFEQRKKSQKNISKVGIALKSLVLLRVPHVSDASKKQCSKFFHLYEGPYRIVRKVGQNAFVLSEPDNSNCIKGTYNRSNLRPYYTLQEEDSEETVMPPVNSAHS